MRCQDIIQFLYGWSLLVLFAPQKQLRKSFSRNSPSLIEGPQEDVAIAQITTAPEINTPPFGDKSEGFIYIFISFEIC